MLIIVNIFSLKDVDKERTCLVWLQMWMHSLMVGAFDDDVDNDGDVDGDDDDDDDDDDVKDDVDKERTSLAGAANMAGFCRFGHSKLFALL